MKRLHHVGRLGAVAILGAFLVAGCDDSPTDPPAGPDPDAIEVSPGEISFAAIGATQQLAVTVWDEDGEEIPGPTVSFDSSDEAVATVDENGLVTAVGNGSATITAESGSVSETVEVIVEQVAASVDIEPDEVTLTEIGATEALSGTVIDAEGAEIEGAEVTWSSSDEAVATVNEDGEVEAVGEGTATITATSGDATGSAEVTVALGG